MDAWKYLGIKPFSSAEADGVALMLEFSENALLLNSRREIIKTVSKDMFSILAMEAAESNCIIKVESNNYQDGPRPEGFPPSAEALWLSRLDASLNSPEGSERLNALFQTGDA